MSVRPRDAYETAQQFSLRSALGGSQTAAPPPQVVQTTGLSFDLRAVQQMQQAQQAQQAQAQARAVQQAQHVGSIVQAPSCLSLRFAGAAAKPATAAGIPFAHSPPSQTFAAQRPPTAVQAANSATRDAAVMRLTAQVEDVSAKLKKAQTRLQHTEAQLTRTSHVLCHERQSSEKAISAYKKDLLVAREAEAKLRGELAGSKKSVLKSSAFLASVDSALASDEQIQAQQRSLQENETKVKALGDFKVKLEAEVEELQAGRAAAQKELDSVRVTQEQHALLAEATATEATNAKAAFDTIKKEHGELLEKLAAARIEEATVSETVSALHVTREVMDAENAKVSTATDALLLEQESATLTLANAKARIAELASQEATVQAALLSGTTAQAAQAAQAEAQAAAQVSRRATISGATAPRRLLCCGVPTESVASQAAHRANVTATPFAEHMSVDAPLGITLKCVAFVGGSHCIVLDETANTGGAGGAPKANEEDRTTAMVQAVVGDLKVRLTEISSREPVWRAVAPLA